MSSGVSMTKLHSDGCKISLHTHPLLGDGDDEQFQLNNKLGDY